MLAPGSILDGYCLIRPIGRGGFGEVWLCRLGITGEFKALKFLPASDPAQLKRELEALIRYRAVVSELQCPQLVPIEHVNRVEDGLFYLMPLADGLTAAKLSSPAWQPKTLAALLCERRTAPAWFSPAEIRAIMSSLVGAVERLRKHSLYRWPPLPWRCQPPDRGCSGPYPTWDAGLCPSELVFGIRRESRPLGVGDHAL